MTVRYVENRYIVKEHYNIHDTVLNKYICVCSTPSIAKHVVTLLNEEPHDNVK